MRRTAVGLQDILVMLVPIVLLGCVRAPLASTGSSSSPSPAATRSSTVTATPSPGALSTTPAPAATPTPIGIAYTCGNGLPFDASALTGPVGAELDDHPAAAVIREPPVGMDFDDLRPPWRLAARTADEALFLSGEDASTYAVVERSVDGWRLAGWGGCGFRARVEGGDWVTWWVDPSAPEIAPSTRLVAALAMTPCISGPLDGRIRAPLIVARPDEVLVVLSAEPPGETGDHCEAATPAAVTIDLGEPLGDRLLLDAATWPARDARRLPPEVVLGA